MEMEPKTPGASQPVVDSDLAFDHVARKAHEDMVASKELADSEWASYLETRPYIDESDNTTMRAPDGQELHSAELYFDDVRQKAEIPQADEQYHRLGILELTRELANAEVGDGGPESLKSGVIYDILMGKLNDYSEKMQAQNSDGNDPTDQMLDRAQRVKEHQAARKLEILAALKSNGLSDEMIARLPSTFFLPNNNKRKTGFNDLPQDVQEAIKALAPKPAPTPEPAPAPKPAGPEAGKGDDDTRRESAAKKIGKLLGFRSTVSIDDAWETARSEVKKAHGDANLKEVFGDKKAKKMIQERMIGNLMSGNPDGGVSEQNKQNPTRMYENAVNKKIAKNAARKERDNQNTEASENNTSDEGKNEPVSAESSGVIQAQAEAIAKIEGLRDDLKRNLEAHGSFSVDPQRLAEFLEQLLNDINTQKSETGYDVEGETPGTPKEGKPSQKPRDWRDELGDRIKAAREGEATDDDDAEATKIMDAPKQRRHPAAQARLRTRNSRRRARGIR